MAGGGPSAPREGPRCSFLARESEIRDVKRLYGCDMVDLFRRPEREKIGPEQKINVKTR